MKEGGNGISMRSIAFDNGFVMQDIEIENIAKNIAKFALSELPEEIQTYEGATYMLDKAKEKLGIMRIAL